MHKEISYRKKTTKNLFEPFVSAAWLPPQLEQKSAIRKQQS